MSRWKLGSMVSKWVITYLPQQDMSESDASDSDGSESASDSEQNDPPSSLVADAEQYELMQRAYAAVGEDFTGKDDLIGASTASS